MAAIELKARLRERRARSCEILGRKKGSSQQFFEGKPRFESERSRELLACLFDLSCLALGRQNEQPATRRDDTLAEITSSIRQSESNSTEFPNFSCCSCGSVRPSDCISIPFLAYFDIQTCRWECSLAIPFRISPRWIPLWMILPLTAVGELNKRRDPSPSRHCPNCSNDSNGSTNSDSRRPIHSKRSPKYMRPCQCQPITTRPFTIMMLEAWITRPTWDPLQKNPF